MQTPSPRARSGAPHPDRRVILRASLSHRMLARIAGLPSPVAGALNALAFVSLTAALLILVLV